MVVGCRRTVATSKIAPDTEWICGKHWALIPARERRLYQRSRRLVKKSRRLGRDGVTQYLAAKTAERWKALKEIAQQRAVGI